MKIKLWINNKVYEDHVEPDTMLLDYLRDQGFKSVKCGWSIWTERRYYPVQFLWPGQMDIV